MGDKAETTKQPVTTMSKPFVLRERLVKLDIRQDEPWRGDDDPAPNVTVTDVYERVTWRWVYVLQKLGNDVTLIGEYWVDEKGGYYPADISKVTDGKGKPIKERQDRQPVKEFVHPKNRTDHLEIHHTITGKRAYHAFYLSNARLPLSSLKKLVTPEYFDMLWAYHLGQDDAYRVTTGFTTDPSVWGDDPTLPEWPGYPNKMPDEIYIRVYDVLLLGMSLNRVMQGLRDLELAWLIPAENPNVKDKAKDAERRKRTEQRQKKRLLAGIIKALLDNEKTKDKIFYELRTTDFNWWLDHYEQTRKKLHDDVATWAKKLTDWLSLKLMAFTVEAHLTLITADPNNCVDDLVRFMWAYAACIDRLMESQPGLDWLDKIVADKSHFIHDWVIDTAKSPRLYVKVFEKSVKAFFGMFKDVFIPYRQKYGVGSTKVTPLYGTIWARSIHIQFSHARYIDEKSGNLVEVTTDAKIRRHVEEGPLPPEVVPQKIKEPSAPAPRDPNATGEDVTGQEEVADQAAEELEARIVQWENAHTVKEVTQTRTDKRTPLEPNWSKDISEEAVANIKKAQEAFDKSMAVVGVGMALYDLGNQGVNTKSLLNAINALAKIVKAFKSLGPLELSERTLQTIGFFTAVLDYYNSMDSAYKEKKAGHTTAYAGYLVAGMGSGAVAVGTFLAIFGAETSFTVIGLVLIAVGTAIVMFGGSTPLQDFMNHCVWGKSYHKDYVESGSAKWSEGDFSGWHEKNLDGLDRQIKALFNVLRSFQLMGYDSTLFIDYGLPPAKINVICQCDIRDTVRYLVYYDVDVSSRKTRQVRGFRSLYMPKDVNGPPEWSDWEEDTPLGIKDLTAVEYSPNRVSLAFKFQDPATGKATDGKTAQDVHGPPCWVRQDIQGDQKEFHPPSGVYIPCKWSLHSDVAEWEPSTETVNSLDYLDK